MRRGGAEGPSWVILVILGSVRKLQLPGSMVTNWLGDSADLTSRTLRTRKNKHFNVLKQPLNLKARMTVSIAKKDQSFSGNKTLQRSRRIVMMPLFCFNLLSRSW